VTDNTPTGGATPKRTAAAKSAGTRKAAAAPSPSATNRPTSKAPTTKAPTSKSSASKSPATEVPATKAPATKAPITKSSTTKAPISSKPASGPVAPPALVEAMPPAITAAAAATAPAGWYPVAAGSPQQRWWDGARWTEHVYDPRAVVPAAVQVAPEPLRAPAGVKPGTVWFWLIAIGAPVLQILELIPASIFISQVLSGDTTDVSSVFADEFSAAYLVLAFSGWFIYAVCIVFAALDWRELKSRGIPRPFHWAWSFFVIVVGWPAVYVIGRTVVAKRRTGSGLAPLWVFVGLQVAAFVAVSIVGIIAIVDFLSTLSYGLSDAGNSL
jgi:hypothetical protein